MTTPLAPHSRALTLDPPAPHSANESAFPTKTTTSAVSSSSGWDPYEVWRTRVFAAQPGKSKA
jgi:hypothetical protein